MKLWNRIKVVVGMLMVFLLIVATNLIDKNNFEQVEESIEIIYQERLVNKKYVRELTNMIHEKEIAFLTTDTTYFIQNRIEANEQIDQLIKSCSKVIATNNEEQIINNLQQQCNSLYKMEADSAWFNQKESSNIRNQINLVKHSLDELGNVQLEEGKKQKILSRDAMDAVRLFTQIEIYLLVFLGLLIQVVIIYRPKKLREK